MSKKIFSGFTIAIAIFSVAIGFLNCSAGSKSTKVDLEAIRLVVNYPISVYKEKNETKIYYLKDTVSIYYYNDYVLYKLMPTDRFETNQKIGGTEPFLIFKKGNISGVVFASEKDSSKGTRVLIDSFLSSNALKGKDFDIPPDSIWKLVEVVQKKDPDLLQERYASIKKARDLDFDSIYYYYSKALNNIDYTFSKKLDSIYKMKLYKIRLLYNEQRNPKDSTILPKREFLFEIEKAPTIDKKEILKLIKIFQQRSEENN